MAGTPGASTWGPDVWATRTFGTTDQAGHDLANSLSYTTLGTGLALDVGLDLYKGIAKKDWRGAAISFGAAAAHIAAMYAVTHLVLKPEFERLQFDNVRPIAGVCPGRPSFDAMCTDPTNPLTKGAPSEHAAGAAFGTGDIVAKFVLDPDMPKNPWVVGTVIGGSAALTLATDFFRIRGYYHTLSETLMGDAVGFGFGFLLPIAENALGLGPNKYNLSIQPNVTTSSFSLSISGTLP